VTTPAQRRPSRLLTGLGASVGLLLGLWIAAHRLPWLGPMLADGLRAVVGVEAVSDLEDVAYGAQDRVMRWWRSGESPKARWEVPTARPMALPERDLGGCEVAAFSPKDVGPVNESWSAPGDGRWVALTDTRHGSDTPRMYKTLLHPDPYRSWAAVSVVAIDLQQVGIQLVAGKSEPRAETIEAQSYVREALVPPEHHNALLAAFNGGFKAEHGHYGMHTDGVTFVPPRSLSCGVVGGPDGKVRIGDWERMRPRAKAARWWRQTPSCMVEDGKLHDGLKVKGNKHWGATVDGKTVIRRSAIGVSRDGETLFVGIGDHVTARAIALAMKQAGSRDVAQLDVNWSYPKFVTYAPRPETGLLIAHELCEGFEHSEDEFVRARAPRDFFYLTRSSDAEVASKACAGEEARVDDAYRDSPPSPGG
jgi:hypothetical protein